MSIYLFFSIKIYGAVILLTTPYILTVYFYKFKLINRIIQERNDLHGAGLLLF